MSIKRGHIYLIDFGIKYQSELGKVRPALVWQSDYINDNLDVAPFKSVIVIPLTTDIKGGKFRFNIDARDNLQKNSELILNWICSVDFDRFKSFDIITELTQEELKSLKQKLDFVFGYMD